MDIQMVERTQGNSTKIFFRVSRGTLLKIRSIVQNCTYFPILKKLRTSTEEYFELPLSDFYDLLVEVCSCANNSCIYTIVEKIQATEEIKNQYRQAKEAYLKQVGPVDSRQSYYDNDKQVDTLLGQMLYDKQNHIDDFLKNAYAVQQANQRLYLLRDLQSAKNQLLKNLKMIISPEEVLEFEKKYDAAGENYDVDTMQTLLRQAQQQILDHWKTFVTNPKDYHAGEDFYFICHSTTTTQYQGEFSSRFVSCSLLSHRLMDTYRSGFGFIFAPNYIVGAMGQDMYVNNRAEDESNLTSYSSIPHIEIPEIVLQDCLEQKRDNLQNQDTRATYNEVVIDGFEPIAIFCLTDGSKTLNNNYNNAQKLKECFPHLEIVEIDQTLYLENQENLLMNLITVLEQKTRKTTDFGFNVDLSYSRRFDYFWKKYLELKRTGNYEENDIIEFYRQDLDMIHFYQESKLFSGAYDQEQIRHILWQSYTFNMRQCLEEPFSLKSLNTLYQKLQRTNYRDIDQESLNQIIDGLGTFLELYPQVPITEDFLNQWNQIPHRSLVDINRTLTEALNQRQQILQELHAKIERKEAFSSQDVQNLRQCLLENPEISRILTEPSTPSQLSSLWNCIRIYPSLLLEQAISGLGTFLELYPDAKLLESDCFYPDERHNFQFLNDHLQISIRKRALEIYSYLWNRKKIPWTEEEMQDFRYLVLHEPELHMNNIKGGNLTCEQISRIYWFCHPYSLANDLNRVIPGLGTFLELYPHVKLENWMLANQEQSQELSLEGICQVLLYQLQNQKHTLSSQQENCQKEISQKEKLIYDIEQNHKILNYTFSYHLAMLDARDIRQQITQNRAEYEDFSKAYIDGEQQLIDKKLSQLSLERFSVLHYLQKKQLQKELYELEQSCREYQQEMQRLDSCLRVYQRQWEQICRKFQKETGYDIHQFANVVRKAKRFISQHADILEERCQVDELKLELSKIQVELAELEPVLRKYSTEHHLFQK